MLRRRSGFTLIELLAVMLLLVLLAAVALPNLSLRSGRALVAEARQLAASLEFARQRTVMTGRAHRLVLDLDRARYWLEWNVSDAEARGGEAEPYDPNTEWANADQIPLLAPREGQRSFRPLVGAMAMQSRFVEEIRPVGVQTATGFVEGGLVEIPFGRDGTAGPTEIVLADDEGRKLALRIQPLADHIEITRVD